MILLDTHVVVWLALDPTRVSTMAKKAILHAPVRGEGLAISAISLYELTRLSPKRGLHLDITLDSFIAEVEAGFVVMPITGRACLRALTLPKTYPRDPGDRIIGGTVLVEGLSLVTADRDIRNSRALPTIW